jgi:hypothetical protein
MMRNEIDLSQHRPSRISRVVLIASTLGVALIAAWVFAPILLANYTAATATLSAGPKPRPIAQDQAPRATLAAPAAQAAAPAPITTASASADEQAPPAAAPTRLTGLDARAASSWPQDPPAFPRDSPTMSIQPAPPPADDADTMRLALAAPAAASAEALDHVPLPRKRPSHLIAARLAVPLPRPRPTDIESDAPSPNQAAFDLQVERMR